MTYKETDSHTIIVGDFNTTLSILDRSTRQKINKDIQDLNSDLEQVNLNIYRTLHPKSTNIHFPQYHITPTLIVTTKFGSKSLLSNCIAFHGFK